MQTNRIICLLLAISCLASAVSCSSGSDTPLVTTADGGTADVTSDEITSQTTEVLRKNTPDSLPALDFKGETVTIISDGSDGTKNYELIGDEKGDVVSEAVYSRNRKVEERLNVKLEFIQGDANAETFMKAIRTALTAGDDSYNIVDGVQWRMLPQALDGLYYDLADVEYIDYSQPWWAIDYMEEVEWNDSRSFCLHCRV